MAIGYTSYGSLETEVLAASPVGLVRLLYRGALDAVADARLQLKAGDIAGRSRAITKAESIVAELAGSLKANGGELSRTLGELYSFVLDCLARANYLQVDGPLADADKVLRSLASAWSELDPVQAANTPPPAAYTAGEPQRCWVG